MNMKSGLTMLLLASTFCLLFHAWTCSANPGLSVQVSKGGFDYASQLSTNKLHQLMQNTKIPDMSTGGRTQYGLSNIKVNSFSGISSHVELIPSNQLKWTVSVDYIQISLDYRYAKKMWWFWIRHSGSAGLKFTGTQLSITVATFKTGNGGLNIKATSCSSNTYLKISTGNIILKLLLFFFKGRINREIRSRICSKSIEIINNNIAPRVSNYPVTIPFSDDYVFDYGLDSNPVMSSSYMKTNHKAAVYYKNGLNTIPFTPKNLPSITGNNKMITFIISNYVFNTWLYAAYQKGKLKYTLSTDTLPANIRPLLQTTCPGSTCIGSNIPQIGDHFPNSMLTLAVLATDRPQTVFLPNNIQLNIPAEIKAIVVTPKTKEHVFTIKLGITTGMNVTLKGKQISFGITQLKFTLGAINSTYIKTYNRAALQNTINPLLDQLAKYFNGFGLNGLPLVTLDNMDIINVSLRIVKDAMILAADLKMAPI